VLGKASHKFQHEFDVELHSMDNDRELMARHNARCEVSGMAEYDHSVSRLREVVHQASVTTTKMIYRNALNFF